MFEFIDEIYLNKMTLKKLNEIMIYNDCEADFDYLDDDENISYEKIINDTRFDDVCIVYYMRTKSNCYTIYLLFNLLNKKYCRVNKVVIK